ncbi:hypothetical protein ABS71_11330 [bacterium SCN 62-11]|nr:hypothetical protein [Candidatus Eremiobacteraeota bacterium]ODT67166.1 MAG: hypothetical protein ABS71_11330 [bacterium SCN 62-11]
MRIDKPFARYQLNNSELVRLAATPRERQKATLDRFLKEDERQPYTPDQLKQAFQHFGLDARLQQLEGKQDQSWSPWECGLYRRLSLPDHDPSPSPKLQGNECAELAQTALGLFERLDQDHNGRLCATELDEALHQADVQGADAAAVIVMRCFQKEIGNRQGITRKDLEKLKTDGPNRMANTFRVRKNQAGSLSPRKPIMEESFDPKEIRQGSNGTCVSLSTLIGTDADHVRSMFQDNGDGSVTVRLKDGSEHRVEDVSLAERLYHARGKDDERWPALLELALGERLGDLAGLRGLPDRTPRSYVATGQMFSDAYSLMLGQKRHKVNFDHQSPNQIREKLSQAVRRGGPLVTASRWETGLFGRSLTPLKNGVVGMHAYAILGYDEKRDTVTLRNPWHKGEWVGAQDGQDDGTFDMPFLQFYASYGTLVSPAGPTGLLRTAAD